MKSISAGVKERILAEAFKENEKLLLKQSKEKMKEEKRKDKNARINYMIFRNRFSGALYWFGCKSNYKYYFIESSVDSYFNNIHIIIICKMRCGQI